MSRFFLPVMAAAVMLVPALALADDKAAPAAEVPLPGPLVTLAVEAPNIAGPWAMVITNGDSAPARIHADARLLRLLVAPVGKKYVECQLPATMREGDTRDLVLKPGETYREEFDPRLLCFSKVIDEMAEGTSVTAFWGYKPDAKRAKANKPQLPPFVVEPAVAPATFLPEKQLVSVTTWIPAPTPKGDTKHTQAELKALETPPLNAPHLLVHPVRLLDAPALRDAKVTVTVKNVGDRAGMIHIRPDQLELQVTGPAGRAVCGGRERHRAPVRDFFRTIAPKGSETLTVLLAEACPREMFKRPGLYEVQTILHATADGSKFGLHAITGDFPTFHTALVRLQQAKDAYHKAPPAAESKK
ncbi:MAG: hypothetical protein HY898_10660 [Deltaproteobacteria bacterium]|nr:hypothetical protein [Deltaproteobacteria bacterium]